MYGNMKAENTVYELKKMDKMEKLKPEL